MIAWNSFAELLQGPGCGRMGGDITVQNAATSHLHDHEHVQHSEPGCDRNQEISRRNSLGVIPDKRTPVLRGGSLPSSRISILRPVRPHRSWRKQDPEFHRQLCCHALLAPGRILLHHAHNQQAKVFRNPRPS